MILETLKDEHNKDFSIHNIFMIKVGFLITINMSYYSNVISMTKFNEIKDPFMIFLCMVNITCFMASSYLLFKTLGISKYYRINIENLKLGSNIYKKDTTNDIAAKALISSYIKYIESEKSVRDLKNKDISTCIKFMIAYMITHFIYILLSQIFKRMEVIVHMNKDEKNIEIKKPLTDKDIDRMVGVKEEFRDDGSKRVPK